MNEQLRILIAGGGVGGLEAALALRVQARAQLDVTMITPERHFTYRPLSVGEPFGGARTVQAELQRIAEDRGFRLIRDVVDFVDSGRNRVITQEGEEVLYDVLVLALGAWAREAVPGALTFRGPRDTARLAQALEQLEARAGGVTVTFTAGPSPSWTLPLYELALLTEKWARDRALAWRIEISTPERKPLEAFGPTGSDVAARLLSDRGIGLQTGCVRPDLSGSDLVVALPELVGPRLAGVPHDHLGFVAVDEFCRVRGVRDVYAIGDMTQCPVKQGGLSAQMADVAAADIAAGVGAPVRPKPFLPVLRGMLFTGEQPIYLRNPTVDQVHLPAEADLVAPWWPPHKIFGTQLAPYLATHADLLVPVAA